MTVCFAGTVVKIGPGVTRFQVGDRVVTNSAGTLRNDARFGALQRYALTIIGQKSVHTLKYIVHPPTSNIDNSTTTTN
jgi:NADPH:quinone reductase-like Zn-dependent oxidoreductase